jgi:hypothetical protein
MEELIGRFEYECYWSDRRFHSLDVQYECILALRSANKHPRLYPSSILGATYVALVEVLH